MTPSPQAPDHDFAAAVEKLDRFAEKICEIPEEETEYAAARSALLAQFEDMRAENDMTRRVFDVPGCLVFLDGRNEHGSHVIPTFPTNVPWEDLDIDECAEDILCAAEAAGFAIGEAWVWTTWSFQKAQIGDEGRVEIAGYWEFRGVDVELSNWFAARFTLHPSPRGCAQPTETEGGR